MENIFTTEKFCLPWPFFFSVILLECSRHYKFSQESQLYPVCPWLLALKCKIHTLCSLMTLPLIHPLDSTFSSFLAFPCRLSQLVHAPSTQWHTLLSVVTHLNSLLLAPLCTERQPFPPFCMASMVGHSVVGGTSIPHPLKMQ